MGRYETENILGTPGPLDRELARKAALTLIRVGLDRGDVEGAKTAIRALGLDDTLKEDTDGSR